MLTGFQIFSVAIILAATFAGGYVPLFSPGRAGECRSFPLGQAFASGVFLALSMTLMLPSAFHVFERVLPGMDYPVASFIAVVTFLFLLSVEHFTLHIRERQVEGAESPDSPVIALVMTVMIAIPSFFLGAALGVSDIQAAVLILIAILAHKSSAGFALALKMVKSTMTRRQSVAVFTMFACSTPLGIVTGGIVHSYLGMHVMLIVKASILSLAAGTFLYMGTLHELRHTPLIENCCSRRGFCLMLAGFIITALVRLLIGEAHHM